MLWSCAPPPPLTGRAASHTAQFCPLERRKSQSAHGDNWEYRCRSRPDPFAPLLLPNLLKPPPSPARGHFFQLRLITPANHFQFEVVGRLTKMANLMKGIGVRPSHKALADHCHIQSFTRCHSCLPKTLRKACTISSSSFSVRHDGIASKMLRSNMLSATGHVPF